MIGTLNMAVKGEEVTIKMSTSELYQRLIHELMAIGNHLNPIGRVIFMSLLQADKAQDVTTAINEFLAMLPKMDTRWFKLCLELRYQIDEAYKDQPEEYDRLKQQVLQLEGMVK